MIEIYKSVAYEIERKDRIEDGCWVNVFKPEPEELQKLSLERKIPLDFLMDSLDVDERSRIEIEDDTMLMIIRVPVFDPKNDVVPFVTLPLGILLNRNIVVTVCASDIVNILDLFNSKIKNVGTKHRNRFFLFLFLRSAFFYLKYLKEINKKISDAEAELEKSPKNEALMKLLDIEKSLVFFTTSLKSNELMMDRLQRVKLLKFDDDERDLLEDVMIDNKQAIEMAVIYRNILSGMMDAFASIISNNLNIVMKFLTSVTIILMLPTLVASIYGMNVDLPFQHSAHAFTITIGISFALSAIGVLIFLKKKWF